jgi:hypothetical protein
MATVTGYTAEHMLEIENASIVDGAVEGDNLILMTRGGTEIDAGNVRGPAGLDAAPGSVTAVGDTTIVRTSDGRGKVATPTANEDATTKSYVDGRTPALTSIDASTWVQSGWGVYDATTYGPLRAWYDPYTKWIEMFLYIKRTGANTSASLVHSPIIVPSTYRPQYNVVFSSNIDINAGAEQAVRTVILRSADANPGRIDLVLTASLAWNTNRFAFMKTGWKVP